MHISIEYGFCASGTCHSGTCFMQFQSFQGFCLKGLNFMTHYIALTQLFIHL